VSDVCGVKPGDRAEFQKTVTAEDIQKFAEVTGDMNPLHSDAEYAKKTRFGECIAHGMLSAGFISAVLGTKLAP
jgi:3-hydroxybutyryl-CoA dehydratase